MRISSKNLAHFGLATAIVVAACGSPSHEAARSAPIHVAGAVYTVNDTTLRATFDAAGVAAPLQQATLSTKIMGTVTQVLVHEGDVVRAGQTVVRIDARELTAKSAQASASVTEAEAMQRDATTQAGRIRALYADSAATRAQLDAVETGLARADAALSAARAAAAELGAVSSYAEIRAPFGGVITKRFVDPGAFAAPGAPLVTVQDVSQLRLTASAAPEDVAALRRGQRIDATIEETAVRATIEGVVPATTGNLYTVNARVPNPTGALLAGGTATLSLPLGARTALVVPAAAVSRTGDLTGVTVRTAEGDVTRWIRLGRNAGAVVEVLAGLRSGDQVVLPVAPNAVAERN
jgi:RND family efflux transporter MFP subunit